MGETDGPPDVEEADYYVAPDGDDMNPGTIDQPFATWQHLVDTLEPGQLGYIRGGVYPLVGFRRDGVNISNSGTPRAPIRLFVYPGEHATLDRASYTYDGSKYCFFHGGDWWHFRGFSVANVKIDNLDGSTFATGLWVSGSHNVLELLDSHHHEGGGIALVGTAADNLVLNSDSHDNYDSIAGGGNADGFRASYLDPSATGNVFSGCRAWWNSDDGYDLWETNAPVRIEDSWSFWNGFIPGTETAAGNGDGFKCGRNDDGPLHVLTRCGAFENRARGFDSNGAAGALEWTNSIAYENGTVPFQAQGGAVHFLRNNIAVGGENILDPAVDDAFNSWSLPVVADANDFVSTDSSEMAGAREADGGVPRGDFLKLSASSDLMGAGENGADLGM